MVGLSRGGGGRLQVVALGLTGNCACLDLDTANEYIYGYLFKSLLRKTLEIIDNAYSLQNTDVLYQMYFCFFFLIPMTLHQAGASKVSVRVSK